jgi:hypothetical protein
VSSVWKELMETTEMSESITRTAIRVVSKAAFNNVLKKEGFRRQANHMHRQSGGLFHGVHFQASQWGSAVEGSFTVNLIVTFPGVYAYWTGTAFPANPATASFPVQQRIGLIMPGRLDRWWTVAEGVDLGVLSEEVALVLSKYGVPFFDRFPSCSALLETIRRGEEIPGVTEPQMPLIYAMLAQDQGFSNEAQNQIRMALRNVRSSGFRETIQLISKRLGLQPEDHHSQ